MSRKRPQHRMPYRRGPYCFQSGKKTYVCDVIWMQTFGPIPQGMVVTHINGNPFDNRPGNLQLTRLEGKVTDDSSAAVPDAGSQGDDVGGGGCVGPGRGPARCV